MKKFELWIEGYSVTGSDMKAIKAADIEGDDFDSAVRAYVEGLPIGDRHWWSVNIKTGKWCRWGCKTFDNEAEARVAFG